MATRIDGTTDEHLSYYDLEREEYEKMFPGLDKNLRDVALRARQVANGDDRNLARKLRRTRNVLIVKNDVKIERKINNTVKIIVLVILGMIAAIVVSY